MEDWSWQTCLILLMGLLCLIGIAAQFIGDDTPQRDPTDLKRRINRNAYRVKAGMRDRR